MLIKINVCSLLDKLVTLMELLFGLSRVRPLNNTFNDKLVLFTGNINVRLGHTFSHGPMKIRRLESGREPVKYFINEIDVHQIRTAQVYVYFRES